jgi:hypothetical protein
MTDDLAPLGEFLLSPVYQASSSVDIRYLFANCIL